MGKFNLAIISHTDEAMMTILWSAVERSADIDGEHTRLFEDFLDDPPIVYNVGKVQDEMVLGSGNATWDISLYRDTCGLTGNEIFFSLDDVPCCVIKETYEKMEELGFKVKAYYVDFPNHICGKFEDSEFSMLYSGTRRDRM